MCAIATRFPPCDSFPFANILSAVPVRSCLPFTSHSTVPSPPPTAPVYICMYGGVEASCCHRSPPATVLPISLCSHKLSQILLDCVVILNTPYTVDRYRSARTIPHPLLNTNPFSSIHPPPTHTPYSVTCHPLQFSCARPQVEQSVSTLNIEL